MGNRKIVISTYIENHPRTNSATLRVVVAWEGKEFPNLDMPIQEHWQEKVLEHVEAMLQSM